MKTSPREDANEMQTSNVAVAEEKRADPPGEKTSRRETIDTWTSRRPVLMRKHNRFCSDYLAIKLAAANCCPKNIPFRAKRAAAFGCLFAADDSESDIGPSNVG